LPPGRAIMPRSASACMSSWKKCSRTASSKHIQSRDGQSSSLRGANGQARVHARDALLPEVAGPMTSFAIARNDEILASAARTISSPLFRRRGGHTKSAHVRSAVAELSSSAK
jgi:hypothetical protein